MKIINLNDENLYKLEEMYKSLASATRLKILIKLQEKECTVNELVTAAKISQSATSHQLQELKNKKIVKTRKDGLNIYYSLKDNHILNILQTSIEHLLEGGKHE